MRIPRPLVSLLLAASVLAGQWLAATHDRDHAAAPNASHSCAICVYAHSAGAGALPVAPMLHFDLAAAAPAVAEVSPLFTAPARRHPIRGPPQIS